tara:strand:- start:3401 stop:4177 length:777 start_codon:yes stop_codon:yes gene_type:complete
MNNQIDYKRNELLGKHNRRLRRIRILNEQYKKGLISYEEYSQKYEAITKGKSISHHQRIVDRKLDQVSKLGYRTEKPKIKLIPIILGLIMLPAIFGLGITGFATTSDEDVTASLEITQYIAGALNYGSVDFETINMLGDNNGTQNNYNNLATGYYLDYSPTSSVYNTKVCLSSTDLISGSNILDSTRMEYADLANVSDASLPNKVASVNITNTPAQVESGFDPGERLYQRYWLDLSGGVSSGNYAGTGEITITGAASC